MPHLPDITTATEEQMDQLRIPTLALDHVARIRSDIEHDRRLQTAARPAGRPPTGRLAAWLAPRRSGPERLEAEPC